MARTKDRPLPAKKLNLKHSWIFFFFSLLAGLALIYTTGNIKAAAISLFTLLWYNGIYTYSKRITAFAVVPGALTGALPPLIGWVAAGGGIWDKPIIFLEFLFFAGQVPHFWILILKYGNEYRDAGIPSLVNVFSRRQINRLTFIWVILSVIAALFLCYFEIILSIPATGILLFASVIVVWQFSGLTRKQGLTYDYRKYSIILDLYFLLILILLILDKMIV